MMKQSAQYSRQLLSITWNYHGICIELVRLPAGTPWKGLLLLNVIIRADLCVEYTQITRQIGIEQGVLTLYRPKRLIRRNVLHGFLKCPGSPRTFQLRS